MRVKVYTVVRPDYVRDEIGITYDDNKRPIMSVVVEREDGESCYVFAPTAQAVGRA